MDKQDLNKLKDKADKCSNKELKKVLKDKIKVLTNDKPVLK